MAKKRKRTKDNKVMFKADSRDLKKIRKKRKRNALKEKVNIRKILMWIFILSIVLSVIFTLSKIIGKSNQQVLEETEYVLGLENIPIYPGSSFLYGQDLFNQIVKDMLAQGQSAYKINGESDFGSIKEYYANELIGKGWNLVLDVEIGAEDKRYGQYWIKEEKGLRIYSKFNDIWYEYITPEEAENGLGNRVSEEIEINMLLAGSDYQELLPDYPWQIKIPKDYLIKYEVSEFEELRAVSFQRISTGRFITIYPIGYWGSKPVDFQLEDYTNILSQGTEDWNIINSTVTSWRGISSLTGLITSDNEQREILMLKNDRNKVTYILSTEDSSDPLYKYITENIKYLGQEDVSE
jgi:hypothetical protein